MELRNLTPHEFMELQNRFSNAVILAGRTLCNLTVILIMTNQYDFSVLYTENNFDLVNEHRYNNLKQAFEDYDNAYAMERGF